MDWNTLIWALVLFIIVSILAWYIGRCQTPWVTALMDTDAVEWTKSLLKGAPGKDGNEGNEFKDDPDLAFHRLIRLPQAIFAVLLLLFVFYTLLDLLIEWKARLHYEGRIHITPVIYAEMGLPHDESRQADTGRHILDWLRSNNRSATLFLSQLTGDKQATTFTPDVNGFVRAFLESEIKDKSTPIALQRLLVRIGGQSSDEDGASQVNSFLKSMFLKPNLIPASFEQMVTNLNLQESLQADTNKMPPADSLTESTTAPIAEAAASLPQVAPEGPTNQIAETDNYLAAVKRGLFEKFEDLPGLKAVTASIYERIRQEVLKFRRVYVLFVGEIQIATIALYLLALVLLGSRSRVLAMQGNISEELFAKFAKTTPEKQVKDMLSDARGEAIVPNASPADEVSARRELDILEAYQRFLAITPGDRPHSFVIGGLTQIYHAWESLWATKQETPPHQVGREILSNLVARNEARLDKVEYSLIDYLVWAMPSLGFIGTVVGISQALGDADEVVRASDQISQAEAITLVTSVLGIAFDTTLIALVCTIPVMLLIALYRSGESGFLLDVDQRISSRLFQ